MARDESVVFGAAALESHALGVQVLMRARQQRCVLILADSSTGSDLQLLRRLRKSGAVASAMGRRSDNSACPSGSIASCIGGGTSA